MPILDAYSFEFFSRSADQTRRLGQRLGGLLQIGDLLCLSGDLGSGKTTLVQGIAQGWGSLDPVTSPTFVLANGYRRIDETRLNHLDAYRLNNPAEAEDLDLEAMIEEGPLVIEWADRIDAALPVERLAISLRYVAEEQRVLFFHSRGERADIILDSFRKSISGG